MDTVFTVINYILMAIAGIAAIIWSSTNKDYEQKWRLWIYEAIVTLCLFVFFGWPIPYGLLVATIVVDVWNPYEPIAGTFSAKHEAERKAKNEQYAKEHPLTFNGHTAQMAEMASWVKHFGR